MVPAVSLGPGLHHPNLWFFGGSCLHKLNIALSSNSPVPGIALPTMLEPKIALSNIFVKMAIKLNGCHTLNTARLQDLFVLVCILFLHIPRKPTTPQNRD